MGDWADDETGAWWQTAETLRVVDGLLSFMTRGVGKPSDNERSLFAATIVFTYGVWESYVEELAIETVGRVSAEIDPADVPPGVRSRIEKGKTAWELAVSPGWRELWCSAVKSRAVGDESGHGMNTAGEGQVKDLLGLAGVADPFLLLPMSLVPKHLRDVVDTPLEALGELVRLRGAIVHTAQIPPTLKKPHAREWRDFIDGLIDHVDQTCRTQVVELLGL